MNTRRYPAAQPVVPLSALVLVLGLVDLVAVAAALKAFVGLF